MNKFSPNTKGFYDALLLQDYINAGALPDDAVDVSPEDEQAIRAALERGDTVALTGHSTWAFTAQVIPFDVQAAPLMAEVRATRELILNRLAGIGMAAVIASDTNSANAIAQARQALLDLPTCPPVLAAMGTKSLAALEDAVKVRYKEIVAAVPLSVRTAFNQVSQ